MSRNFWFPFGLLILILQACTPKVPVVEEIVLPPPQIITEYSTPEKAVHPGLIVIDAGHGGDDFGAHSVTKPLYHEKNLNLTLARMLKNILDFQGYQTAMTRNSDLFIALDKRAEYANRAGAELFVSVHFNSAPSAEASGIEVYYYRSEKDQARSKASLKFAKVILDEVIKTTHAKSRGAKHGDFAVIRKTEMPAVLVEAGFLTNASEMEKIKDPAYLKKIAAGISSGIKQYLNQDSKS